MTAAEKEQVRKDIAETFAFVRFLVKKPALLRKIKNGSEIRILPAQTARAGRAGRGAGRVQFFAAETTFHSL
jgi:hypothetical protein